MCYICPWKLGGFAVAVHANHSDIRNFRVGKEDAFQLCRWDLESLGNIS